VRVISANLWGKFGPAADRWPLASDRLAALKPDILCLQEATIESELDRVAAATHLRILASDTESTGLAILSKHRTVFNKTIRYKTLSHVEDYSRKFEVILIEDKGGDFLVLNTHLSWKNGDDAARAAQASEMAAWLAKKNLPALLCGDFNCEYASAPLEVLRKAGYKDTLKGTPDENLPTWDNANPFIQTHRERFPDRRIDLILANASFLKTRPLKTARIVLKEKNAQGLHASDHYGVLADFD